MKCQECPALFTEGYEYPEEMCTFGIEGDEFKDGTYGCRKTRKTIEKDLAEANRQFDKYLEENAESYAKFCFEDNSNEESEICNECYECCFFWMNTGLPSYSECYGDKVKCIHFIQDEYYENNI